MMMHLEDLKTQSAADLYTNGSHACVSNSLNLANL